MKETETHADILSEKTLYKQGNFALVERYLAGWHSDRGQLTMGWTGQETIETSSRIKPSLVVTVYDWNEEKKKRHQDNLDHLEGYFHGVYYHHGIPQKKK